MCGVSCLCSVAVGGGGPPSRGVFQFLLLVFCVLCCERLRLGHRWYPVCLCRRPLRPAAAFGLCAYTGGVPVPFPAAVGGGMLVVRPGTVQARRASSARSFPRDGRPRDALSLPDTRHSLGLRPGPEVLFNGSCRRLPLPGPRRGRRSRRRYFRCGVGHRRRHAEGWVLSAFGSTASMRPSRHRAAAPAARPGLAAKPPPERFASASAAGRSSALSATATATGVPSRCAGSQVLT